MIGKSISIEDEYAISTPSICYFNNNIVINTRYVNYRIDDNGNYINQDKIITKNIISIIDKSTYKINSEFILNYDTSLDNHYVGLEDVRLFSSNDGRLLYNANRGLQDSTMRIEHGEIDLERRSTKDSILLSLYLDKDHYMDSIQPVKVDLSLGKGTNKKDIQKIEKNWVLFNTNNDGLKSVYNWYPLTIGDIKDNEFRETHQESSIPHLFKYIRGSTNGVMIDNEIWFICHAVSYESRRYYYHIVVVLDKDTYNLKKYTPFFLFEKEKVEYTLGFVEMGMNLLIGYSILDKSSEYMLISKDWFKSRFILV
jgi:hypothetical protein